MNARPKKTILIDLDGVLNTYNGNYDKDYIPSIRDGAYEFLKEVSKDYRVLIFTSRNLLLTAKWVTENNLDKFIDNVTNIKEPSFLIIDDRCINFRGDYTALKADINAFNVWYKPDSTNS